MDGEHIGDLRKGWGICAVRGVGGEHMVGQRKGWGMWTVRGVGGEDREV